MGIDRLAGRKAAFLDRDGVLNRNVFNPATGAYESPHRPEDFALLPGVMTALAQLRARNYLLFLVSNQPSYAKAKCSLAALHDVHARLQDSLAAAAIDFAGFYYCYHHPDGIVAGYSGACRCRKPSPYFLLEAARDFDLTLADSWMIGDRASDVFCGRAAGVRTIRVAPDHPVAVANDVTGDFAARDLAHAAALIAEHGTSDG
ncbi:MAG TPA: HAD family hydrolase [Stellaceae bacterium]|nr:HAD family hydrolase [Stellaceae bacterium]